VQLVIIGNERCIKIFTTDSKSKELHGLVEQLNNGSEQAFTEIYKRCSGHIAFVCHKFCDSKEDIEEVVQDTFLNVFKKAGTLKGETFMALLRKIAIYTCLRKRNTNLRLQQFVITVDDEQKESYPELHTDFLPEAYLQDKENRIELLQVIKSLPEKQWKMIYMYYYAEFNTEEIAQVMECSSGYVRHSLFKARNTIKAKLEAKDKRYDANATAFIPIAGILFAEETAFVASYVPAAAPAAETASLFAKHKAYIITASIAAACAVSAVLYFTVWRNYYDISQPYEPIYIVDKLVEYEPAEVIEVVVEEPSTTEPEPTKPEYTPAQEPEPEPMPTPEPQEVEEPQPDAPTDNDPIIPDYEPELPTDEPDTPTEEAEPEPIHIDRTPQILAALATADNQQGVDAIIANYGFAFERQIRLSTYETFRFYVTNEGSGDILIGIAGYEDRNEWVMRFEHYSDSDRPLDFIQLLRWIQQ